MHIAEMVALLRPREEGPIGLHMAWLALPESEVPAKADHEEKQFFLSAAMSKEPRGEGRRRFSHLASEKGGLHRVVLDAETASRGSGEEPEYLPCAPPRSLR
ncbi:unnamed protein product [Prorocentrum cordatum]|uniref:Uncharacterized protein n=1 Tax=Prorocentrum cordatum TaxID=2364126 RepID=A0ABN9VB07_9DINO|nr:unnamed protein product [Polarella glacialis]